MDIVDIVLGCSFGDEGKGKVVFDLLNNNYDLCVRFNGSGNAGHTIYLDNQKNCSSSITGRYFKTKCI